MVTCLVMLIEAVIDIEIVDGFLLAASTAVFEPESSHGKATSAEGSCRPLACFH
jgi:hypothetical protein